MKTLWMFGFFGLLISGFAYAGFYANSPDNLTYIVSYAGQGNATNFTIPFSYNYNATLDNGTHIGITCTIDGTEQAVPFFRETGNFIYGNAAVNSSGIIWVKIPNVQNSSATNCTIYINATTGDFSDIRSVSLAGTDFSGTSINTTEWNELSYGSPTKLLNNGIFTIVGDTSPSWTGYQACWRASTINYTNTQLISRFKYNYTSTHTGLFISISRDNTTFYNEDATTGAVIAFRQPLNTNSSFIRRDGVSTTFYNFPAGQYPTSGAWATLSIIFNGTHINYTFRDLGSSGFVATPFNSSDANYMRVGVEGYGSLSHYALETDWIMALQWAPIMPTAVYVPSGLAASYGTPTDASGSMSTGNRTYIEVNVSANMPANITIFLYNSAGAVVSSRNALSANYLFANFTGLADGLYYFNASAINETTTWTTTRNVTINRTLYLAYTAPTPSNNTMWNWSYFTVKVSATKNISSCTLTLAQEIPINQSSLWTNVKHLNITSGEFNYNASIGLNSFTSPNMAYNIPVQTGIYHTCYLLNNGSSICYGYNYDGQSNPYTGNDAVNIGTGSYTCYVLRNGNGTCRGVSYAEYGGGNAVQVAVNHGGSAICWLLDNGNSVCYGNNDYGQATNYTGGNAVKVSGSGLNYMCYLLNNGNSVCYGNYTNGAAMNYSGGDAIDIASAITHTCYLLKNGNGVCYGIDWDYSSYDSVVNYTGGDAIAVGANLKDTCFLRANGNVACYGKYHYSLASLANYTGGDAIGIAVGGTHSCVLVKNGTVYCWGNNLYGAVVGYTGGDLRMPFMNGSINATQYTMSIHNADANSYAFYTLVGLANGSYTYFVSCDGAATETHSIAINAVSFTPPPQPPTSNNVIVIIEQLNRGNLI